jgi:hypothetical protein
MNKASDSHPPKPDVTAVFDLGHSGGTGVAEDKDALLAEALEAELERAP